MRPFTKTYNSTTVHHDTYHSCCSSTVVIMLIEPLRQHDSSMRVLELLACDDPGPYTRHTMVCTGYAVRVRIKPLKVSNYVCTIRRTLLMVGCRPNSPMYQRKSKRVCRVTSRVPYRNVTCVPYGQQSTTVGERIKTSTEASKLNGYITPTRQHPRGPESQTRFTARGPGDKTLAANCYRVSHLEECW